VGAKAPVKLLILRFVYIGEDNGSLFEVGHSLLDVNLDSPVFMTA
jgi:hypothetical protein